MGSLLLAAGEPGMRFSLPNARYHGAPAVRRLPGTGVRHPAPRRGLLKIKRRLNEIYVQHTGRDYDTIDTTPRSRSFMSADEAKAFGIVDQVVTKRTDENEESK